jgi:excinuclease ABC subunit A
LFAQLPEARMRGYGPGRFSFNVKGGRCEACQGDGIITIEMHFLPDVYVTCEVCGGSRYARETLEVRYRGKHIAEVLDLTVGEALEFLTSFPAIRAKLLTLCDVGLDYVRVGQPATTLSGGEAQRIKLARELARRATGKTLYVLDEPTTGLHFEDVRRLIGVLERLADQGNTVVVIEHNLDVIKIADRVIDLGPEGGDQGGRVVATGTPEQVAATPGSHTGRFLHDLLSREPLRQGGLRTPGAAPG